jgi:hypothetical protein
MHAIRRFKPELNHGTKASKAVVLKGRGEGFKEASFPRG